MVPRKDYNVVYRHLVSWEEEFGQGTFPATVEKA